MAQVASDVVLGASSDKLTERTVAIRQELDPDGRKALAAAIRKGATAEVQAPIRRAVGAVLIGPKSVTPTKKTLTEKAEDWTLARIRKEIDTRKAEVAALEALLR